MPYINDSVFDAALSVFTDDANRLDVCSAEPSNYANATSTLTLGNKTGITVGSPEDRTPNGRKVTVSAISDGSITANGTAAYWAISDTVGSVLLATGALSASQSVTNGNTFTLSAFDIGVPDVT